MESVNKVSRRSVVAEGKGKDVVLQECFNCHAMSKIGVEGRDRDAWLEAIEHMRQVGVANIKPDVADQVSDYLEKFWSGIRSAEIAGAISAISKSQAGARLLHRRRSEYRLCRLSVDREPRTVQARGSPTKMEIFGWKWVADYRNSIRNR